MRCLMGVVVVLACASGCPRRDQAPPVPGPATEEEGRTWAGLMEPALNSCDRPALERLIDMEVLGERAIAGKAKSPAMHRGLRAGMRNATGPFIQRICESKGDGRFRLLRVHTEAGTAHALIRLLSSDGVNYMDYMLGKRPGAAEVRAHDAHVYITGQRLSETIGEMIAMVADDSASRAAARAEPMTDITRLQASGKNEEALAAFDRLDPELRNSRGARALELQIAAAVSDEAYQKAIAAYEKAFPGDPSVDFVSIDGYFMREDYPRALAAVERMDKRVGGDPYLQVMRGTVFKFDDRLTEARTAIERAIVLEPYLKEAHWALLSVAAGQEDYATAVGAVKTLRGFGERVTREQLIANGGYEDFLASKEAAALFAK